MAGNFRPEPELELKNLSRSMGGLCVLQDVEFSVFPGERVCLLGPSGCGKTTLIRMVAGLDVPDFGDVLFRGKSLLTVPPHKRRFGMMFQDFALFPHRNVFKNIAFGLEMQKLSPSEIEKRVHGMLELVSLEGFGDRRITELSGGERQRVALARTLAPRPRLLMLDEPLGALDRLLRERLLADLCLILDHAGVTTLFVTHDHNEAFAAADRVCIMHQGRVEQIDEPKKVFNHPATGVVADFLGFQNLIAADKDMGDKTLAVTHLGQFELEPDNIREGGHFTLLILPDAAVPISRKEYDKLSLNRISGRITDLFFQGSLVRLGLETHTGERLLFDFSRQVDLPVKGEPIYLAVAPSGLRMMG